MFLFCYVTFLLLLFSADYTASCFEFDHAQNNKASLASQHSLIIAYLLIRAWFLS